MNPYASRDLMVGVLPGQGDDAWAMGSSCSGCTNNTKGACITKPKDSDLDALVEQLRTLES